MNSEKEHKNDASNKAEESVKSNEHGPSTVDEHDHGHYTSGNTTDDDHHDEFVYDPTMSADAPISALAGPALVSAPDLDDRTTLAEEFDWAGKEDDDDELEKKDADEKKNGKRALAQSSIFLCLSQNSSSIAWACVVLFALVLIAVDVAIFVSYNNRISMVSYNLELWFTWLAFMWCIGILSQLAVEIVPWIIKKSAGFLRPHSTEVLRMRLSYYMALRPYIKLIAIAAWAWGSWSFCKDHIPKPPSSDPNNPTPNPSYANTFYSIWECCFFASLLLFIEKFILQLIVTSFHKKAYGDRIRENERALKILDKLKKVKRKTAAHGLLKHIRRKPKSNTTSATPSRRTSTDDRPTNGQKNTTKSIMTSQSAEDNKMNVTFPKDRVETLIAIPPVEDRHGLGGEKPNDPNHKADDETKTNDEKTTDTNEKKSNGLIDNLKKWKNGKKDEQDTQITMPPQLYRHNTDGSASSQREKSFLGATRDAGLKKVALPGKLLKGGYNKIVSSSQPHTPYTQSTAQQAKVLAKKIYHDIVGPGATRSCIMEDDFYPFFPTREEAAAAFGLFDIDGNGDVSKRELRSGCVRIYRERKNLVRSMRDLSQATGKLDIILLVIFIAIWVIIVCAAFGVNVGTELMPLWSAFIAASFIFGNSAKDAFDSIIFVFVTHCFDAGDRVLIGVENWVVAEVGLLVTTFIKWDGSIVYAKNSVLSTQYIINCRRTGRTGESIELHILFSTPSERIQELQDHMLQWSNQYPKLYTSNATSANIVSFANQNKITMSFYFEHTQNWQDPGGRWLRHNNFMMELKKTCERLDITYSMPPVPVHYHNKPNDAPPESYNQGEKSSYGLEGLRRRHTRDDGDQVRGASGMTGAHSGASSGNAGLDAGAASMLAFGSMAM